MPTRNYKPEQIVTILRQIEVQMANGKTAPQDIVNLRFEGRSCARSARVGQPTVTASQVAKERVLTSRW